MPATHRGPSWTCLRQSDHFSAGDIVVLEGETGFVRSLYRPYERHHSLFITERCSSNCLMCSQPPKDKDDTAALTARNRELIRLMQPAPSYLTITGEEPTLAGDGLLTLLEDFRLGLPESELHMLTNGRIFAWPAYTSRFAEVGHPDICLGIRFTRTTQGLTTTSSRLRMRSPKLLPGCTYSLHMASGSRSASSCIALRYRGC